jgi:hypothetical protein
MNLKEILKESNEKMSDTTINNYIRNLFLLNDSKEIKNLNFLNKYNVISDILDKKKDGTKRNYYISIVSVLKGLKKENTKVYKFYHDKMMGLNKDYKKNYSENKKSEKQNENWMDISEVENKLKELGEKVENFENKGKINKEEYNILLRFLILSLYTLQQPRRNEYKDMNIIKNKKSIDLNSDINYLLLDEKQFLFRKYKTAKTELKKENTENKNGLEVDIPEKLMKNINIYLKFHPLLKNKKITKNTDIPFLVYYDGSPFKNVNSITYILNKIFKKNVGSSLLRSIYLSSKYGDVLDEMKNDAKLMSHNLDTQKMYIKN